MPDLAADMSVPSGGFTIEGMMMRYNIFTARLYNYCKSLGMRPGKILPSRAFCSDENQGFPIIMLTKHFGAFPFNHGQVGGVVATDRHGPHADHGENLVIIQASHVGYDPASKEFGSYKRLQTDDFEMSHTCGKIFGVLHWYQQEYDFASRNISLVKEDGVVYISIDNHLLRQDLDNGLILRLNQLIKTDINEQHTPVKILSTSKKYLASDAIVADMNDELKEGKKVLIGDHLKAELFNYRRQLDNALEGVNHLELNLIKYMPVIITAKAPAMLAAQINTQVEFDRAYRTLVKAEGYKGKNLLFIAGLNIDISPEEHQLFPLTKFIPWAAYIQKADGSSYTLEQDALFAELEKQPTDNPDQINLEDAIQQMREAEEVKIQCC
ncbi:MAG: hypothetical protein OQK73_12135 [Gammaproteobacteria bacterium]|nr:hypothetical protein [Gammaproteobacteria bacterium]